MKYEDLIQFDPIETTIQLVRADKKNQAQQLVSSYVISEEMAERLSKLVFPQLQFDQPADNKGLLIVGNYGTGKSHLMSVISAIAEYPDLSQSLRDPHVAESAVVIAGRFKVARTELNTEMSLRDVLCSVLEHYLESIGVRYSFPPADSIPNNKIALESMMEEFHKQYPDHGLLLVVDELLDYLRSRMGRGDSAVILDLNFLREVGEVARDLKFRFIAGIQVSLFDNPQFQFVADSLRRVKDRFEQIYIARKDIKYVVAERLLSKTADQQVKIRQHLTPFAKFYGDMNERMDEFVRLFPIHPDYIDTFERLTVVEKRQVMKSLSQSMQRLLKQDVPQNEPGLVAFDSYWEILQEDASFRTIPDVARVIECNARLESIVELGYPKNKNKKFAQRVIRALSVFRLAVGDIEAPVGLTAESLRDTLCLFDPLVAALGGDPAEDLRGAVETALRLISTTVNGQFISATDRDSRGRPGGQFYLDVKKTVDYDAQIEKRVETLGTATLDRYYFDALKRVMECTDETLVPSSPIWQHELEWIDRKASRLGYLFFGAPNERSTAQPPREFYLYFLPHYREAEYRDEKRADELFFRVTGADETFDQTLRRYAAAVDLSLSASGDAKRTYEKQAATYLQNLVTWLQERVTTVYEVTYRGITKPLLEWIKGKVMISGGSKANVRDIVNALSSACLDSHFASRAPEYPRFSGLVFDRYREQAAQDALKGIASSSRTKQAISVLDALKLLDGDQLVPTQSMYAEYIRSALQQKGQGQVLNRSEVLQDDLGVEYMAKDQYRLEPEWVVVLISALVRELNLTLTIPGKKFDAMNLAELVSTPVRDLVQFQHLKAPKDYDVEALKALYTLMGLQAGLSVAVTQGGEIANEAMRVLQLTVVQTIEQVVLAKQALQGRLNLLGRPLLTEPEQAEYRNRLDTTKGFLESLQAYNSPGKLKNFRYGATEVNAHRLELDTLQEVESLKRLVENLGVPASYLSQAELVLPGDHPWVTQMRSTRDEVLTQIGIPGKRNAPAFAQQTAQQFAQLKQAYINAYMGLHTHARLSANEDREKAQLLGDRRLQSLNQLASIKTMHVTQLTKFQDQLAGLKSCFALTELDLQGATVCPHCGFKPVNEGLEASADDRLQAMDEELNQLVQGWTERLLDDLEDPTAETNLELLSQKRQKLIQNFRQGGELPAMLNNDFIQALNEVLSSLSRVLVTSGELTAALLEGGSPMTPDEMEQRFKDYLSELTKGKDRKTVRIILEQ
jgi:hypothetical protein